MEVTSIADEKRQTPHRIRLAELLASISLATDLAHDVPAESALRDALLAVKLATLAGWSAADISDVYYLALLYHIGCTGAVAAQSRLGGGDDINVRRWMSEADYADRPGMMRVAATKIAPHWGATGWPQGIAGLATAERNLPGALASTAEVASILSQRLGASPAVTGSLSHAYGRWDGKVFTSLPSGTGLSAAARLVHLVHVAQVHAQVGGIAAADAVVRRRSGAEFDPELAKLWLENSHEISRTLAADSVWDMALEAEPDPHRGVGASHLDEVSRALADFVDLASQFTRGHSRCVARLAEAAGKAAGLGLVEVATLRRAGDVHDLGMLGVPNRVWTRRGPLSPVDWERVRMHAYHTQRILGLASPLRPVADLAAMHHERLDGSGYHRGLQAGSLSPAARILAVTEVYQAMREERPWRPALAPDEATRQLRNEIAARRLDAAAVDAVLTAAGQPGLGSRSAVAWPAKLTDREVDVLRVLAVGLPNKQIAVELHVSEATVKTHIINIYGKIGVNTRAGATLFALEHDLLDGSGRVSVGSRRRPAGAGGSGK